MTSSPPDPVTLILPVRNAAAQLAAVLNEWSRFLQTELGRGYDIILVDDGSTDKTPELLDNFRSTIPHLRLLKHPQSLGFGASLRTALAEPTHPIVCYSSLDYPYTPADLLKLLGQLGKVAPVFDVPHAIEAVSGCRTGRPVPPFWKIVGGLYRIFARIALGISPPRLPGWLGFRDHFRSWWLWLAMGVPLADVNSAFKVFRRSLFDRFPIQSDSDFVHAEIFAKLTFLSVLVAEEPLSPKSEATPKTWWSDFWAVLKDAKFHTPLPDLTQPTVSPTP
ncbi:glycosyltransferase family 2 protein [Limnoglobus roseus]|nr:glycosyltransferase family 2 protein [Limnoglobus roseus]